MIFLPHFGHTRIWFKDPKSSSSFWAQNPQRIFSSNASHFRGVDP